MSSRPQNSFSVCLPRISTHVFKTFKLIFPCWFVNKETTTAHLEKIIIETIRGEYLCYSSEMLLGTQKCSVKWKLPSTIHKAPWFSPPKLFLKLFSATTITHKKKKINFEAIGSANFTSVSTVVTHHIFLATTERCCTYSYFFLPMSMEKLV